MRAYEKYWIRLRDAPMNRKYNAKVLTLKLPESLVKRVKRMISKEKDMDWEFRNENALNPWSISFRSGAVITAHKVMNGHGTVILTILMDRRTDI